MTTTELIDALNEANNIIEHLQQENGELRIELADMEFANTILSVNPRQLSRNACLSPLTHNKGPFMSFQTIHSRFNGWAEFLPGLFWPTFLFILI